ncbi:hypothetical protein BHE74_00032926 [Ensete ventricosum]|nr:hypothetical protein BHE74_00032926 [Ensete ventricosum]RZS02107.1 hypothetical protein BHM03_00032085 [Ensete ventricosum]
MRAICQCSLQLTPGFDSSSTRRYKRCDRTSNGCLNRLKNETILTAKEVEDVCDVDLSSDRTTFFPEETLSGSSTKMGLVASIAQSLLVDDARLPVKGGAAEGEFEEAVVVKVCFPFFTDFKINLEKGFNPFSSKQGALEAEVGRWGGRLRMQCWAKELMGNFLSFDSEKKVSLMALMP